MSYQAVTIAGTPDVGILEEARRVQGAPYRTFRSSPVAAAVSALAQWTNTAAAAYRVDAEIEAIRPQINASIRNWSDNNPTGRCYPVESCGCLIHVILGRGHQTGAVMFVSLFQADCGLNPTDTLESYLKVPAAMPDAPEGHETIWRFVWTTAT
jgi:hypothetical protein